MHYTAYELNKDGNVIDTSHIVDKKQCGDIFARNMA
jgi:hypothetical protein